MGYVRFRWTTRNAVLLVALIIFLVLMFWTSQPRPVEKNIRQKTQFHALSAAIELFGNEFDGYPPSDANDRAGQAYCGAMKLAEALVGQDLRGFHVRSAYRADGLAPNGHAPLYPPEPDAANLKLRNGPFLPAEGANAYRLVDIYGKGKTGPFPEDTFVLCDTYGHRGAGGQRTGMPILYYRANPSGTAHDVVNPDNPQNIYNYKDNQALLALGVPGKPGETHPLADAKRFYLDTESHEIPSRPYRADTFILISAGPDGLYGTADDICNFEWKSRER